MAVIPGEPTVISDVLGYGKLPAEAHYAAAPLAAGAHIYGHRARTIVPALVFSPQRMQVEVGRANFTTVGKFRGRRSDSGASGRWMVCRIMLYCASDARLELQIEEDDVAAGSPVITTVGEAVLSAAPIGELGMSLGQLGTFDRSFGFLPEKFDIYGAVMMRQLAGYLPMVAEWRWQPHSSIGTAYEVLLKLKDSSENRAVQRIASVLVHEENLQIV